jgi:hypothetical protein
MTMDDARIKQLTEEVLGQIRGAGAEPSPGLEARVAALEAAVRALQSPGAAATTVVVARTTAPTPAALQLLGPSGGGSGACVLEPDKPCVGSGQCRSFGH